MGSILYVKKNDNKSMLLYATYSVLPHKWFCQIYGKKAGVKFFAIKFSACDVLYVKGL